MIGDLVGGENDGYGDEYGEYGDEGHNFKREADDNEIDFM